MFVGPTPSGWRTSAGNEQSLYFADEEFWSLDGPLLSGSTPSGRRTSAGNEQSLYFADKEFWSLDGPLLSGSTPSGWMKNFSFKKKERLAKRPEFDKVMAEGGKKRVGKLCIIFSLPNKLGRKRLGIIASKKVGNAVARNRVKRRIRETFRQIKHRIKPTLDIVVISGKDMVTLPYQVIEKELSNALLTER